MRSRYLLTCGVILALLAGSGQAASDRSKREQGSPAVLSAAQLTELKPLAPSAASQEPKSSLLWYDAKDLLLEGKGWKDTPGAFCRLPARAQDFATSAVWFLSKNTAGIVVHFYTDSPSISAVWDGGEGMVHMALTGSAGLDLYTRQADNKWKFLGVGKPQTSRTLALLAKDLATSQPAEYLLYLPLYHSVNELKIGIDPKATIASAPQRKEKPIVFYGTSITQGGCASRAGMCHVAMLGRWLDREVINLGFSGSGKMEPALAPLFAELDPSIFVLECLPNMTKEMVDERMVPFVKELRKAHPDMPILMVENLLYTPEDPLNVANRKAYDELKKQGVKHLEYLRGDIQLEGPENATVDGVHPTDLGFLRVAQTYYPKLKRMLSEGR